MRLDAALGLPDEKYSHELRRIVAEASAKSSFEEGGTGPQRGPRR
jgi:hypothetical protein